MRSIWTSLWLAGAAAVSASASGEVFYVDSPASPSVVGRETVSPKIARLIFARRLGLSDYYNIDTSADEELHHIDAFGGPQEQLFSQWHGQTQSRVVVLVDGISQFKGIIPEPAPTFMRCGI